MSFSEVMNMPYPVFNDYLNFTIKQETLKANKQKKQINEIANKK